MISSVFKKETHLDETFSSSGILIDGFSEPFRRDRNCIGSWVFVYLLEYVCGIRRSDLEMGYCKSIWIEDKINKIYLLCKT